MSIHRARQHALIAIALAGSIHTPLTHAQRRGGTRAGPAAAGESEARDHFQTGIALYEERNFEGALAEFEESYRLRPVPIVLFNVAQSQRQLLRYAEAIDSFSRYLDVAGSDLPTERRTAVLGTIDQLRNSLGTVDFDSDPPGAEIRVDGRSIGTTPRSNVALGAGRHVVELAREGYLPVREEVTIIARRTESLRFRLAEQNTAAELVVQSRERGARVAIDGIDMGVAPVTRMLSAGGHRVIVRAQGFVPYSSEVLLAERQHRTLRVELDTPGGVTSQWYFWAPVGAVVAAGLIVGGYFLFRPARATPIPGNGDPDVIEAIRIRPAR